jgi:hypothetical protein
METRCQGANPCIHQIVNTAAACALGSKISAATNAEVTAPLRLGRATITVTAANAGAIASQHMFLKMAFDWIRPATVLVSIGS